MTFVVMSLLFVSCNDDYPDDGYFKVNETSYTVNEALLKSVGLEGDYHQLRLTLNNTNTNDEHSLNFFHHTGLHGLICSLLRGRRAKSEGFRLDDPRRTCV